MEPLYLRAAKMLREIEWTDDFSCKCPRCYRYQDEGHRDWCELVRVIELLEAMEGTAAKVQRKEKACSSR